MSFFVGVDEPLRRAAGSLAFGPKGIPHTYRVESDQPARWLAICTPGDFAAFVLAASRPAESPALPPPPPSAPSDDEVAAITSLAGEHGIELLGRRERFRVNNRTTTSRGRPAVAVRCARGQPDVRSNVDASSCSVPSTAAWARPLRRWRWSKVMKLVSSQSVSVARVGDQPGRSLPCRWSRPTRSVRSCRREASLASITCRFGVEGGQPDDLAEQLSLGCPEAAELAQHRLHRLSGIR